jgi:predicted small secreted protein
MRRSLRLLVVLLLCSAATSGCGTAVGDAESRDTLAVAQSLTEANSAVQAALLAVQIPRADITSAYQHQVVADAEKGLDSAVSTFDGRQPPNTASSNALDAHTGALLDRAGGDLRNLRIAVERDDQDQITNARRSLAASAEELAKAADELSAQ